MAEQFISIPIPNNEGVRPRRSFLDQPIGSFRGVNSLSKFASSFQRSNDFKAIESNRDKHRSFLTHDNDELVDWNNMGPSLRGRRLSSLLQQPSQSYGAINNALYANNNSSNDAIDDGSLYSFDPVSSTRGSIAGVRPAASFHPDQEVVAIKQVENANGDKITMLAGQSTAPQTIFNSINVLIGIGLLALPLGFMHSGWIFGLVALTVCAFGTYLSAVLLSRCIDVDPTMMTYADLGYAAFGPHGRAFISVLFTLDLMGSGVALIVLFGDSLNALFPSRSVTFWKIVGFFVVTPQTFMPLSILSSVSLLGILSTIGTVIIVTMLGSLKPEAPGSLRDVMPTHLFPATTQDLLLSIGILMAPFGGHAVFPNLKADMRHPHKFNDCLKTTYSITFLTDTSMAIIGFLMFGMTVKEEVTRSVLLTPGYPKFVYALISALMAMIPIAKTPLNARPIVSLLDFLFGIHDTSKMSTLQKNVAHVSKFLIRIGVNVAFVIIAIIFPAFDKILAFMGAGICFIICFILPCSFYLIICKQTVKPWERLACQLTIFISCILAVLGTYAAIVA